MTSTHLRAVALGLTLAACAPDKPAPVEVVVLVYNAATRVYEPQRVKLTTVEDIVEMRGPVANIIGEAEFLISSSDPALASARTEAELRAAITKDAGNPVKAAWIESDGALLPADFHSLNIATTYYNFERAFALFSRFGLTTSAFGTPEVYYFPEYTMEEEQMKDNAMFFSLINGFLILPFEELQQIPLAINGGVIGHEYSHRIFNHRVFDGAAFPAVYSTWTSELSPSPGMNLLKSLNEGIADVFGTAVTCDDGLSICQPGFVGHSLSKIHEDQRRVDVPHCLDKATEDALLKLTASEFSDRGIEYTVGSVFANALWRAGEDHALVGDKGQGEARRQMLEALYRSLGGIPEATGLRELVARNASNQELFRLQSGTGQGVLDAVVNAAEDPQLKAALCSAFLDRFHLTLDDISACPQTSVSYGECPAK